MPDFLTDPHSYLRCARNSGLPVGYFPRRDSRRHRALLLAACAVLAVLLTIAAGWPT